MVKRKVVCLEKEGNRLRERIWEVRKLRERGGGGGQGRMEGGGVR